MKNRDIAPAFKKIRKLIRKGHTELAINEMNFFQRDLEEFISEKIRLTERLMSTRGAHTETDRIPVELFYEEMSREGNNTRLTISPSESRCTLKIGSNVKSEQIRKEMRCFARLVMEELHYPVTVRGRVKYDGESYSVSLQAENKHWKCYTIAIPSSELKNMIERGDFE